MIKNMDIGRGRSGHFFVCDACGEPIREKGVVVFAMDADVMRYAHRGNCHRQVESAIGGAAGWHDISYHLFMLAHNSGYTPSEIKDRYVLVDDGLEWETP